MIMRRIIVLALAAAAWGTSGLNTALSQAYPSRPVTLIVPYPAGGPTDSLARLLPNI
jgi:tripartite-type tricarboxylate transporter receptor subunit TctC